MCQEIIEEEETRESMFIWAKIPSLYQIIDFVNDLFEQTGILFIPCSAFGMKEKDILEFI